jgi:hypothetical protein
MFYIYMSRFVIVYLNIDIYLSMEEGTDERKVMEEERRWKELQ